MLLSFFTDPLFKEAPQEDDIVSRSLNTVKLFSATFSFFSVVLALGLC